ncbi:hypothetical protein OG900_19755 [Streptomyces sp. NBC_00433]
MTADGGATARQANIGGPASRALARAVGVTTWAVGLVLPALALFGDLAWTWSLFLLLTTPLGFVMWWEADDAKDDTVRLQRSGRRARAELVRLERVDPGDGSPDVAVMRLRISGEGVPDFEATYRCDHEDRFTVGTRFVAVVDPSDNLFTLKPLPPTD